jgi:hypothetical protein
MVIAIEPHETSILNNLIDAKVPKAKTAFLKDLKNVKSKV